MQPEDPSMGNTLFIVNDGPYGNERPYNALRLAGSLAKQESEAVRLFLMGDAAVCAKQGQKVPNGYYKIENMLRVISQHNGQIGVCGTCMDARGIADTELVGGTRRSSLDELAQWTRWADKVLVF
jgi:uncharacterized protein involved in oxidation of intracellular sulfur